jgi:hypothetical protein
LQCLKKLGRADQARTENTTEGKRYMSDSKFSRAAGGPQEGLCAAPRCHALARLTVWPLNPALSLCDAHKAMAPRSGWRFRVDLRCKADPLEPAVMSELVAALRVAPVDLADAVIRRGLDLAAIERDLKLPSGAVDAVMRKSPAHRDAWLALQGAAA